MEECLVVFGCAKSLECLVSTYFPFSQAGHVLAPQLNIAIPYKANKPYISASLGIIITKDSFEQMIHASCL